MIGNGVQPPPPQSADEDMARERGATGQSTDGRPHPLDELTTRVRELIEYANLYVETRKDTIRSSLRRLIWMAGLGVLGGIAGVTVLVVATVYVMGGIADAIGLLFG